jgi:hypothetical protein
MKTSSSGGDILPYSRDPNVLFYNGDNNNNKEMLTVKKRYKNVYLKVALSLELPANTLLYEAVVDWYNTHIKVFMDADDALNNIPIFEGGFRVLCKPRDTLVYVREAFQFLSRGHSIHNPACICPFQTPSDGRIEELGLPSLCSSDAVALCPLNTHRHRRTTRDIAMELGISDIRGLVQVVSSTPPPSTPPSLLSMPLLDVLVNLAGFSIDGEDEDYVSCFLCCGPTKINSAQTILDAAKAMFPKSFLLDCRSDDCETKSLKDDLKMLQMRSLVRAVGGPYPDTFSVFYMDKTTEDTLAIQVDDDIKSAWKNVTESLCKFFNGPSQESVEKMLLDENIQPMRVQQATSYNNDSVKIKKPSHLFKKNESKVKRVIKNLRSFNNKKD